MWIDHLQHFFSLVVYKGVKPEENIPDITCFILIYTVRELIWLIGKHSPLSLTNKLLIYKMVLKPIWTYGLALWGCAASSNLAIIQRYQAKILRQITNAPRYVTNHTLHKDLLISQVRTVLQELTDTHRTALQSHPNPLMAQILAPPNSRRLLRKCTLDVIT